MGISHFLIFWSIFHVIQWEICILLTFHVIQWEFEDWKLRGGRTDRQTDEQMEIHPCVLQDIGPLGPLPKKEQVETVNLHVLKVEFCSGGSVRARFKCSSLLHTIMTLQVSINNNQPATLLTFEWEHVLRIFKLLLVEEVNRTLRLPQMLLISVHSHETDASSKLE